jgi:DNA-binding transcriptional MocR family regulator
MQVMDYHEAIFASKLSAHAKLTALAISSYYNWNKKQMCWPSNKTLSNATGLSISSVVRSKKELAREGFLEVQRRIDNSNLYRPLFPQTIGYVHTEQKVWSNRATNNEYNNEVNNGKKDSNESLDTNNNLLLENEKIWEMFR